MIGIQLFAIQNLIIEHQKMKDSCSRVLNIDTIIRTLIQTRYSEKSFCLKQYEVEGICVMARHIFAEQPMLLELQAPLQICGDTHGQFPDLLNIFRKFGSPHIHNYLFLGDYVDRGKQSLQCICLLLAYKIKFPQNFFLLRGNHESSELNKLYGFYDECKRRLNIRIWKSISDCFNYLPAAAVVAGRIFCVHGGLSPVIKQLSTVNCIRRPIDPQADKMLSDMLWSDPKPTSEGWSDNVERGISHYYGSNVVNVFLNRNEFDLICRSHQVVEEGYEFCFERKLITIFSAPNYCGQFINMGAILLVSAQLVCKVQQFKSQGICAKRLKRSVTPAQKTQNIEIISSVEARRRKGTRINGHNIENQSLRQDEYTEESQDPQIDQ